MGDILHAMPAVAALRQLHPDWHIAWAIEPRWLPLLQTAGGTMPLVDRVHLVPTRSWNQRPISPITFGEIRDLRAELRAEEYDLCVDMQGLIRSAFVGLLPRAPLYAGPDAPRERPARWLYGVRVETSAPHVIDRGCQLLGGAVGEPLAAAPVPLPCDPDAEAWCASELTSLGGQPFAVLAPTAGWGAKQWPVERYGQVARALAQSGCLPLINATRPSTATRDSVGRRMAGTSDAVAEAVAAASGGVAIPVHCNMAELTSLLRRASVVVAGDTGPLHLAAALGRPVVGLYGPTDPARTGPYGTRSEVIRHASSSVDHRRHSVPEAGLAQITVEEVVQAALRLLETKGGG